MSNKIAFYILIFAILAVAGVIVIGNSQSDITRSLLTPPSSGSTPTPPQPAQSTTVQPTPPRVQVPPSAVTTPTLSPSAAILLVDDQPATTNILVKEVNMPEDGYIGIHALSKENLTSGVIGNSEFLPKGDRKFVRIQLYSPNGKIYSMKPGDQFILMLYKDNGDKKWGKKDASVPIKDSEGVMISRQFKVL